MPRFSQAQVTQAMQRLGYGRQATAKDLANANKYGLGVFKANQRRVFNQPSEKPVSMDPTNTDPTPSDPTQSFLEQLKTMLHPEDKPAVTPFEQSGFYSEADATAAANQEWDPWAQKQQGYGQSQYDEEARQRAIQNMASDKSQLEAVNAAGGLKSSAYQQELANTGQLRSSEDTLRQQDYQKYLEDQKNQLAANKSGFVTNRRNEAYQRYLQGLGAAA